MSLRSSSGTNVGEGILGFKPKIYNIAVNQVIDKLKPFYPDRPDVFYEAHAKCILQLSVQLREDQTIDGMKKAIISALPHYMHFALARRSNIYPNNDGRTFLDENNFSLKHTLESTLALPEAPMGISPSIPRQTSGTSLGRQSAGSNGGPAPSVPSPKGLSPPAGPGALPSVKKEDSSDKKGGVPPNPSTSGTGRGRGVAQAKAKQQPSAPVKKEEVPVSALESDLISFRDTLGEAKALHERISQYCAKALVPAPVEVPLQSRGGAEKGGGARAAPKRGFPDDFGVLPALVRKWKALTTDSRLVQNFNSLVGCVQCARQQGQTRVSVSMDDWESLKEYHKQLQNQIVGQKSFMLDIDSREEPTLMSTSTFAPSLAFPDLVDRLETEAKTQNEAQGTSALPSQAEASKPSERNKAAETMLRHFQNQVRHPLSSSLFSPETQEWMVSRAATREDEDARKRKQREEGNKGKGTAGGGAGAVGGTAGTSSMGGVGLPSLNGGLTGGGAASSFSNQADVVMTDVPPQANKVANASLSVSNQIVSSSASSSTQAFGAPPQPPPSVRLPPPVLPSQQPQVSLGIQNRKKPRTAPKPKPAPPPSSNAEEEDDDEPDFIKKLLGKKKF
uniref:Uncharacterized protein n=1 Tax=Chromera velia CCMP2878 TaxID=1169474 RepID=A0A0G4HET3_9ALVE|eukprot:Cvel_26871.t1-p1 / transcript=Cvel_26871.t1 / gene=Cvel_26871 / organism=Chromera_velia_CCMP2878 / gene_product=hypothetical protein / transcript_product=hypothetical protein / location=Cvel_scaffold3262:6887-12789(+) / protein_length=618 / sequence_SO=supercontig / SO=protein_coding / is_pseudo=false